MGEPELNGESGIVSHKGPWPPAPWRPMDIGETYGCR